MQPFLSIITINYNQAEGLEKTINSVVAQTYKDYEFIIIDGASTDSSVATIQKNSANINYWCSEKDSGIFNAMNKGIRVSRGTYILFLNSGDILNGITAIDDFVSNSNFEGDIIYGDYQYEEGGKVYPDNLTPLFFIRTSLPHQSTFFKNTVFEKMGLYDEKYKIASDRAFYIKCFLSNQFVFKHVNYPLSIYDLSGVSNSVSHRSKKKEEDEQLFREYYGIFYSDYEAMIQLQLAYNALKKQTFSGMLERILNKVKRLCHIQ